MCFTFRSILLPAVSIPPKETEKQVPHSHFSPVFTVLWRMLRQSRWQAARSGRPCAGLVPKKCSKGVPGWRGIGEAGHNEGIEDVTKSRNGNVLPTACLQWAVFSTLGDAIEDGIEGCA